MGCDSIEKFAPTPLSTAAGYTTAPTKQAADVANVKHGFEAKAAKESKEFQTFNEALVGFAYGDPKNKDSYGNILWYAYPKLSASEKKAADSAMKEAGIKLQDLKKYE